MMWIPTLFVSVQASSVSLDRPLVNGQAIAEAPGWIAECATCRRERGVRERALSWAY